MRRFDTVLFDLDGTLLDTLEDICGAANHTLRELGYPERTLAEMRRFVGNGAEMQMRRSLGADADKSRAVYVGDSEVDIETARNAGIPCISVTWGFRDREQLVEAKATELAADAGELHALLEK